MLHWLDPVSWAAIALAVGIILAAFLLVGGHHDVAAWMRSRRRRHLRDNMLFGGPRP